MHLSLNWLKKYVDLKGLTPEEIGLKLTMATAEVEGIEHVQYHFKNIFVAEIIHAEPNKEDAKLKNVIVKLGEKEYKTLCGAPNVKIGAKSVFALPGAIIDGKALEAKPQYKGYSSEGILLSVAELGMSESHVEIVNVPADVKSGTPLSELFPEEDYLIEIDNKSLTHRPDLWGHYGFARELAAVYSRPLKPMDLDDLTGYSKLPAPKVKIEDYENCPRYSCICIDNLPPVPSPMWMQYDLLQAGVRPINLPVDLTNYISLEIGQPMHAFDGEKVSYIRIGTVGKNHTFITLDDSERKMLADDLMIFDNDTPVAIAGIMGGQNTEVSAATTKITLESANFYAARIRRTSSRLGLRTDASQRYEKSQPHPNTVLGIQRYLALAKSIRSEINVTSGLFDDKAKGLQDTINLKINKKYLLERIGADIPVEKMVSILTSLGFGVEETKEELKILVPAFRSQKDISIPDDIVEEVARVYGYDNIKPVLPSVQLSRYHWNEQRTMEHRIRRYLSTTGGMNEVQSYAWFDSDWCAEIQYEIPQEALTLVNYTAESFSRMRTTLMPNLFKMADNNSAFFERFRLYEIGKVYIPQGKKIDEHNNLGMVFVNRSKSSAELYDDMKGILRALFRYLFNQECTFSESREKGMQTAFDVIYNKNKLGVFCVPDEKYLKAFRKGVRLSYCELNVEEMAKIIKSKITFKEPHKFPGTWMDFSIVTDKTFMQLAAIIDRFENEAVDNREFLSLYEGKGLEKNEKSYTFRYSLNYKDHTPSGEEIQAFRDSFVEFLNQNSLKLR